MTNYPAVMVDLPDGRQVDFRQFYENQPNSRRGYSRILPIDDSIIIPPNSSRERELQMEMERARTAFESSPDKRLQGRRTVAEWAVLFETLGIKVRTLTAAQLGVSEGRLMDYIELAVRFTAYEKKLDYDAIFPSTETDYTPVLVLGGVILLFAVMR
jgi:hypothetical protein